MWSSNEHGLICPGMEKMGNYALNSSLFPGFTDVNIGTHEERDYREAHVG